MAIMQSGKTKKVAAESSITISLCIVLVMFGLMTGWLDWKLNLVRDQIIQQCSEALKEQK